MENSSFKNESEFVTGDRLNDLTRYTFICFMVCIALVGILGNAIVVLVLKHFRIKSSTDYFVLAMSCIDFFSATVNTTCYIIRFEPSIWNYFASGLFCRLQSFSLGFTNLYSTLLLAATAFDRLATTGSALTNGRPSATRRAKQATIGIIIASFAVSSMFPLTTTLDNSELTCITSDSPSAMGMLLSTVALSYIFLFIAVIVCYTKIAIILKRHHRKTLHMKLNIIGKFTRTKNQYIVDDNGPGTSNGHSKSIPKSATQDIAPQRELTQRPVQDKSTAIKSVERKGKGFSSIEGIEKVECKIFTVSGENSAAVSNTVTRTSTPLEKRQSSSALNSIERDKKRINRTTLMMFLITSVYVGSWIVNYVAFAYEAIADYGEQGLVFLCKRVYLINTVTNPIFYCIMSTKFKQNAKALLCKD